MSAIPIASIAVSRPIVAPLSTMPSGAGKKISWTASTSAAGAKAPARRRQISGTASPMRCTARRGASRREPSSELTSRSCRPTPSLGHRVSSVSTRTQCGANRVGAREARRLDVEATLPQPVPELPRADALGERDAPRTLARIEGVELGGEDLFEPCLVERPAGGAARRHRGRPGGLDGRGVPEGGAALEDQGVLAG